MAVFLGIAVEAGRPSVPLLSQPVLTTTQVISHWYGVKLHATLVMTVLLVTCCPTMPPLYCSPCLLSCVQLPRACFGKQG
jgi:hypothetical protein